MDWRRLDPQVCRPPLVVARASVSPGAACGGRHERVLRWVSGRHLPTHHDAFSVQHPFDTLYHYAVIIVVKPSLLRLQHVPYQNRACNVGCVGSGGRG